jgi:hypothetical protein
MVYDGTKPGLNDVIWVPRFSLPTVDTLLRAVDFCTYMSDMDIGKMFLNFVLHELMQALCGVDLTNYFGEGKVLWERWTKAIYGLKIRSLPGSPSNLSGKGSDPRGQSGPIECFLLGQGTIEPARFARVRPGASLSIKAQT